MVMRCLGAALIAIALAGPAQAGPVDPADATEIVETLLDLPPRRHATPLAAMHGWAGLYARQRDGALAGDDTARRVWFLMAFAALARTDAATTEAFSADLQPAYAADPDGFLQALRDSPWLAGTVCYFLGAHYGSEDRPVGGRETFLAAETARIAANLPGPAATRCLGQIAAPARPVP